MCVLYLCMRVYACVRVSQSLLFVHVQCHIKRSNTRCVHVHVYLPLTSVVNSISGSRDFLRSRDV